jgi:hypothetical protein
MRAVGGTTEWLDQMNSSCGLFDGSLQDRLVDMMPPLLAGPRIDTDP